MIVIGIGTPPEASNEFSMRRIYDFTPNGGWSFQGFGSQCFEAEHNAFNERMKADGIPLTTLHGGASGFLKFLVDVVRPALARDYRMTDSHTLFGDSAGGIFCALTMFSRPEAFSKYICGSPAFHWGNYELFRVEERYSQTHQDLPVQLFFGAGEGEILEGGFISAYGLVSSMARMAEILKMRAYPSLKLYARIFADEDHGSVIPSNLAQGLRTLWQDEVSKTK